MWIFLIILFIVGIPLIMAYRSQSHIHGIGDKLTSMATSSQDHIHKEAPSFFSKFF